MPMSDYRPLYVEGVRLFNEREFFACHDVLEELWSDVLGPEREFYQGLIQAAVALFHFGEGNLGGARKLCGSASRYLEPYRPKYLGLDVDRFLADFRRCFDELLACGPDWPTGLVFDERLVPTIELQLPPSGGTP
jgi:predicted metal-dependent hydrolase